MAILKGHKPNTPLLWFILTDSGLNLCISDTKVIKKHKLPPEVVFAPYQVVSKSFYYALLSRKTLTIKDMKENANGSYNVSFVASGRTPSKKQLEKLRHRGPVSYLVVSSDETKTSASGEGGNKD